MTTITDIDLLHGLRKRLLISLYFCSDFDDDSTIGHKMEGALVVYLTNDMERLSLSILWYMQCGHLLVSAVDSKRGAADFRLLPPQE